MPNPPTETAEVPLELLQARRLALFGQRLLEPPSRTDQSSLVELVETLCYLQRDPLSVVAPSHLLVLWSRLGDFPRSWLEEALWEQRTLFEYWTHGASVVPTRDFPIHRWTMLHYAKGETLGDRRVREWLAARSRLRARIIARLAAEGPLPAAAFEPAPESGARLRGGWGSGSEAEHMLFHLWRQGKVVVAARDGRGRQWALTEAWLGAAAAVPPPQRFQELVAERSLRALGVATSAQVQDYLGAARYRRLDGVLERLVGRGSVLPVALEGPRGRLKGRWFVHRDDLDRLRRGDLPEPTGTTLLSPFDNLISLRPRTVALFGFDFRMEIYVPPAQRRFGYYVLPILHRGQLLGRVDLRREPGASRLIALAIHAEPGADRGAEVGAALREALERLARFLQVREVVLGKLVGVPPAWRRGLRG